MDISNKNVDINKLFNGKIFFPGLGMCAPWKKFGQKMKNFEIFFDIIDNHACVYMHIKKDFYGVWRVRSMEKIWPKNKKFQKIF